MQNHGCFVQQFYRYPTLSYLESVLQNSRFTFLERPEVIYYLLRQQTTLSLGGSQRYRPQACQLVLTVVVVARIEIIWK